MNMLAVFQHSTQVAIVAIHFSGKPRNGALLLFQFLTDQTADVYAFVHRIFISFNEKRGLLLSSLRS